MCVEGDDVTSKIAEVEEKSDLSSLHKNRQNNRGSSVGISKSENQKRRTP